MAKVVNNLVMQGLAGMIGKQLVVRRIKSGTYVVSVAPTYPADREPTAGQKAYRERFRRAVAYAKQARNKPEYQRLAESRGVSSFNVATADYLHPPEIRGIDLGGYAGGQGQTITIDAFDDVKVASVEVRITTEDDAVVEAGSAARSDTHADQWVYTTTATATAAPVKVRVEATDLAGRVTVESAQT